MGFRLRHGVNFCISNGRTVLFDIENDRYFALPVDTDAAFQAALETPDLAVDRVTQLKPLVTRGMIIPTADSELPPSPTAPQPIDSALDSKGSGIKPLAFARALASHNRIRRFLTREPLRETLKRVTSLKVDSTCNTSPRRDVRDLLPSFLATRLWVSSHDNCLPTSLALIDYLSAFHLFPTLVMGVRMCPYGAHAWVQEGPTVLNDRVDTVRRYTPILVI